MKLKQNIMLVLAAIIFGGLLALREEVESIWLRALILAIAILTVIFGVSHISKLKQNTNAIQGKTLNILIATILLICFTVLYLAYDNISRDEIQKDEKITYWLNEQTNIIEDKYTPIQVLPKTTIQFKEKKEIVDNNIKSGTILPLLVIENSLEEKPLEINIKDPLVNEDPEIKPTSANLSALPITNENKDDIQIISQNEDRFFRNVGLKPSLTSCDLALKWLANHQEVDGHWESGKFEGMGTQEVNCAVTAFALLAFLGVGHTDNSGKWQTNVKAAGTWLIKNQNADGSWDSRNYANGICTWAISEYTNMGCGGIKGKKSAELATDYLLKQQNVTGFFDYAGPSTLNDMSVTAWCFLGLFAAKFSNFKNKEIEKALHKCGEFLDISESTNDNTPATNGFAWYIPGIRGTGFSGGACQAIAMVIRQLNGWKSSEPWIQASTKGQLTKIPVVYKEIDCYGLFFSCMALNRNTMKDGIAWNSYMCKLLTSAQRIDGDFNGSWDLNGSSKDNNSRSCDIGGRVLYTAIFCLSINTWTRLYFAP
jgi:hypothetical protein